MIRKWRDTLSNLLCMEASGMEIGLAMEDMQVVYTCVKVEERVMAPDMN